jgi:ABC-type transporter Mla MlaB component
VGEAIEPKVNPGKMTPVMRPSEDASFDNKSAFASTLAIDEPWGEDNASTLIGVTSNTEPILSDPARFKDAHSPSQEADPSEFPASKLFAVEMGDGLSDPDLEEAAIRFANGDDAGAEAVLLAALQPLESSKASADVWATALFDLYRSTGQHVSFERLALDYAQRFGQSAPVWFSTPEQLQSNTQRLDPTPKSAANAAPQAIWLCSPELDAAAVDQLRIRFLPNSASATLNWAQLQSMTSAAAQALAILFAQWCDQPLVLHFDSAKMLEKVLRTATPLGDAQVPQFWWQLRLDMLRILHLQDEFELAALDYCVTYEVSPPPWKNPRCSMLHELTRAGEGGGHGAVSVQVTADDDWKPSSGFARSVLLEPETEKSLKVELIGELQGDPSKALASLGAAMKNTEKLVISCMRLVRVDFSAAGSILNWVANGEAMGCQIEFRDVPCLVATFFNLIGINEHAQVMSRTN